MAEPDQAVIDEAVHEGDSMTHGELFDLIERSDDEYPGVDPEVVETYARELAAREDYAFDAEGFLDIVDERRVDEEEWAGPDHVYELDGDRLSQYPPAWHEELGGSTDAAEYVRFVTEAEPMFIEELSRGGAGEGIPEDTLVRLIATVGRVGKDDARAAIEEARDRGDIVEETEQHPQARVYLADDYHGE